MVRRAWGSFLRWQKTLFVACLSLIVADDFRISLGDVFGRYWPETWTHDNPSLIGTGTYGFHPFQRGDDIGSFPSGHACRILAFAAVWVIAMPRSRTVQVVVIVLCSFDARESCGDELSFRQRRDCRQCVGRNRRDVRGAPGAAANALVVMSDMVSSCRFAARRLTQLRHKIGLLVLAIACAAPVDVGGRESKDWIVLENCRLISIRRMMVTVFTSA